MSRSRLLTAALPIALLAVPLTGMVALGPPAGAVTGPTVAVHGRLLVVPAELPGGTTRYGVALADGDIVPIRGRVPSAARTGAVFDGRLAVPADVLGTLAARGESGRAAALRVVDRRDLTLDVVGAPTITQPRAAQAPTPTIHPQFVAAMSNKGTLQTDLQLLAHVSTVGDYWKAQSNGAIAGITVPGTVTHYSSSAATADCGLGSDFFQVVQEAEGLFPTMNLFTSPDQLVIFVPDSCTSGGVVGEGTIGDSFASGGALVVKATDAIEGTYAHETGHNYGFEHANARVQGSSLEYYGVYDVMGFALTGFNQLTALSTPYRVFQGITDTGEIRDVQAGTSTVQVTTTLLPRSGDTGVRSVRVVDPDTGDPLYLDYRSGTGQDTGAFYADTVDGYHLDSGNGPLFYAPGVTINAPRTADGVAGSGVDTFVVDGSGDTSLGLNGTWTNASHSLSVAVTALTATAATVRVTLGPQVISPAPTPTISGRPRVGSVLTAHPGTWMTGVALGYRWYVAGQPVQGATHATYTPVAADRGGSVKVTVIGTRAGYPTVTRTSAATAPVGTGVLHASTPTIRGKLRVGRTLTAVHHTWTPGTTFTYRWYAGAKRIKHRTGTTLRLTKGLRGKRIQVKITGHKPGYTAVTRPSRKTGRVR